MNQVVDITAVNITNIIAFDCKLKIIIRVTMIEFFIGYESIIKNGTNDIVCDTFTHLHENCHQQDTVLVNSLATLLWVAQTDSRQVKISLILYLFNMFTLISIILSIALDDFELEHTPKWKIIFSGFLIDTFIIIDIFLFAYYF